MDTRKILADLKGELDRINQAIAAIQALDATASTTSTRRTGKRATAGRKRRHMSAASRKRISEMMKARWAERKKKAKTA